MVTVNKYFYGTRPWLLLFFALLLSSTLDAQVFRSSDTLNQRRVVGITAAGLVGYGGGMYLLGQAWYKNNLSSKFHFFNDDGEWLQMDKVGHVYSGYNESSMVYDMYRWAGVRESKAIWLGLGAGLLAQTSIEIFDGFSTKWGFSWGDIVCNFAGYSLFGLQQGIWHQQRILLKVSSDFRSYSAMPLLSVDGSATDNLARRAKDLYSNHLPGKLLKDYNAQTYWLSFNPSAFAGKESRWPAYLNIALGYSGENLFGGYVNTWSFNGASFQLDPAQYPRYRQFLLSLDLDLRKIPCKSPFWKTVLRVVNIFKIPAPALEFNSQGKFKAHWLYF